jgi:hypothetical protein
MHIKDIFRLSQGKPTAGKPTAGKPTAWSHRIVFPYDAIHVDFTLRAA